MREAAVDNRPKRLSSGIPRTEGRVPVPQYDDPVPGVPKGAPYMGPPPALKRRLGENEGFDGFIAQIDNLMAFMGVEAYNVQVRAAEAVAAWFKVRLVTGEYNNPELSPLSAAMGTSNAQPGTRRKALATLAHHVIVIKPKQFRIGHKKAKPGQRGSPGVFTGKFNPAYVGFEKAWEYRAYQLDTGFVTTLTSAQAVAIMQKAKARSGWQQIGDNNSDPNPIKIWFVPGRNFSKDLASPETEEILRIAARGSFGNPQEMAEAKEQWKKILEQERQAMAAAAGATPDWDSVAETIRSDAMSPEEFVILQLDE